MGKSYAIFNQKGGVGKTTTNINLGAFLARKGKKVLLIDIDPQGNTTSGLGLVKRELGETLYDALTTDDYDLHRAVYHTETKNLDIVPASVDLSGAEVELIQVFGREILLRHAISTIKDEYDYIFIDCPPSLGLLTINALVAADGVIIPIQCEFYALEGVSQLMKTVELVRREMNRNLQITGVILSMFDGRTNLGLQVVQEVKRFFGNKVFKTVIPKNVRLAEAPSYGLSIADYDPSSRGAKAYKKLADEFEQREGR
ncbi:MAG: AAA family ATPase [Eubacteriales bacterium]|nr:AAA family ATPase [Eubacteriales bacterium]